MKFRKDFFVQLSVEPEYQMQNLDDVAMLKLKQHYESKCYQDHYIIKIAEVLRRSSCIYSKSSDEGIAVMSVHFMADVCAFEPDEIIPAVTINTTKDKKILGTFEYGSVAVIFLDESNLSKYLKLKVVPVRVIKVNYTLYQKMTIICSEVNKSMYNPVNYSFDQIQVQPDKIEIIMRLLDDIKTLEQEHVKSKDNKALRYFTKKIGLSESKDHTDITKLDYNNIAIKNCIQPLNLRGTKYIQTNLKSSKRDVTIANFYDIVILYLKRYRSSLALVIDLSSHYPNESDYSMLNDII